MARFLDWFDQEIWKLEILVQLENKHLKCVPRRVLQRQEVTTGQLVQQTRTGVRNVLVPQTVRNSIGDRIINVAFVPFY